MRRVRWIAIVLTVGLLAVAGGAAVGAPTAVLVAGGVLAVWAVLMLGGFGVALCTFAAAGVALAAIALAEDDAGGGLAPGARLAGPRPRRVPLGRGGGGERPAAPPAAHDRGGRGDDRRGRRVRGAGRTVARGRRRRVRGVLRRLLRGPGEGAGHSVAGRGEAGRQAPRAHRGKPGAPRCGDRRRRARRRPDPGRARHADPVRGRLGGGARPRRRRRPAGRVVVALVRGARPQARAGRLPDRVPPRPRR